MQRALIKLLAGMLVLTALPASAQLTGHNQTLVLPLSTALTGHEMARVVTSSGRAADCLAPVAVTRIDGEMRSVSALGFLIEPGIHTLNGKATLDTTYCPLSEANPVINSAADLEVDFEPGGTYHIGYFHASANTEEWKLVVWHIEKSP